MSLGDDEKTRNLGPKRNPEPGREPDETGEAPRSEARSSIVPTLESLDAFVWPVIEGERYTIAGEHARGGLGRILEAVDRRLDRPVAVKELLSGGHRAEARFVREALVTARLQHPSIVPIHEVGRWASGEPFYTMKMVEGRSLAEVIREKQSLAERLALLPNVIAVGDAIAYAHSKRVIHRDLKPSNVLIGPFGETVVIDWGLASDLSEGRQLPDESAASPYRIATSGLTVAGTVMGTPEYMPPEQARADAVDERADVYAIGAMLYHLLAGAPPYRGQSSEEVLRQLTAAAPEPLEKLEPGAPRDLVAIVGKAMARAPAERYATATELAADLKRFQTGQLVSAHHYSAWALTGRWLRRHRAAVTVAACLLVVLFGTAAVSIRRILREQGRAERRTRELILSNAHSSLEHNPTATIAFLKTYPTNTPGWGRIRTMAADAWEQGVAWHVLRGHTANVVDAVFLPDGKRIASASLDQTLRVWDLEGGGVQTLRGHTNFINRLVVSRDGKLLASASNDGRVLLWTLATGAYEEICRQKQGFSDVAFSPDGTTLASTSWDKVICIYSLKAKTRQYLSGHQDYVNHLDFSPDGAWLASASRDGTVRLWQLATGQGQVIGRHEKSVRTVTFSPDGRYLASASDDGMLLLIDVASRARRVMSGHTGKVMQVVFAPDSRSFASAGADRTVRIWDLEGRQSRISADHGSEVYYVLYSPSGGTLASASLDGTVRLWNLDAGTQRVLRGHEKGIERVIFSADGRMLASVSRDATVRVWNLSEPEPPVLRAQGKIFHVAFSADGHRLAFGGTDKLVHLYDRDSGGELELGSHLGNVKWLAFSPDGKWLASGAENDPEISLWSLATRERRPLHGHSAGVEQVGFTRDGTTLVSASDDGSLRQWDVASGSSRALAGHQGGVDRFAFSPDERLIASASRDKSVRLWDRRTGRGDEVTRFQYQARAVAFSNDGLQLASCSDVIHVTNLIGRQTRLLGGTGFAVVDLAFVTNQLLVSGIRDSTLRIWDVRTRESRSLLGHDELVISLALSPDRRRAASGGRDKAIRLWDLESGETRVLQRHNDWVRFVAFSPDGKWIASAGDDGTVRLGRDDLPTEPEQLRRWMDSVTGETIAGFDEK